MSSAEFISRVGDSSTRIVVERNGLADVRNWLERHGSSFMGRPLALVVDAGVVHGQPGLVEAMASMSSIPPVTLPSGESRKSLDTVGLLLEHWAEHGLLRDGVVVSLGGGVLGDVTGLAASLYLRGVEVIQCPTTLLAQVDAAIGGKTAINLRAGKNLAGTFHAPLAVWIDPSLTSSLPVRTFVSALPEILKMALLLGEESFDRIESDWLSLLDREPVAVDHAVLMAVKGKIDLVAQDPFDRGPRKHLNLGHTAGHAVEHVSHERPHPLLHGEAVGLGLLVDLELSRRRGLIDGKLGARVRHLLDLATLPRERPRGPATPLIAAMSRDKKRRSGQALSTILLEGPGRPTIVDDITEAEMLQGLTAIEPD